VDLRARAAAGRPAARAEARLRGPARERLAGGGLDADPQGRAGCADRGRVPGNRLSRRRALALGALCAGLLAAQPQPAADALVEDARTTLARGDARGARRAAERALALDASRSDAHALLAALTGRAPVGAARTPEQALERAAAHPYDAAALVGAADVLARGNRPADAVALLEKVLWLADTDPDAAAAALERLPALDAGWRERRAVPVHVFADETLAAGPGWEFQLRTALLAAGNSLEPVLGVRFVAVSLRALPLGPLDAARLESIHEAFAAALSPAPQDGILAGFTARPAPAEPGPWKLGLAELLGRRLTVRLPPGATESRPLAHELLHLFGAVHVSGETDSLMNPDGSQLELDAHNLEIVRATRNRAFSGDRIERAVLPYVDLHRLIDGYVALLRTQLTLRELGIEEVLLERELAPGRAARRAHGLRAFDPHLAEAAQLVAALLAVDGREAAAGLFEVAAELWGPDTEKGRINLARARAVREAVAARGQRPLAAPGSSPR
jgi:hypothetical protein